MSSVHFLIVALSNAIDSSTGPPVVTSAPRDVYVLSGANVTFNCQGLGYQTSPEPTWLKDSESLTLSERVMVTKESGSLRLLLVTVYDAGTYTCVFKNSYGAAERSAILTVDNFGHPLGEFCQKPGQAFPKRE